MPFVAIDYETYYEEKSPDNSRGPYSLRGMTYEEYIRHELFQVIGAAISVDGAKSEWIVGGDVGPYLRELYARGPVSLLAYNAWFDGAITAWHYKLKAIRYYCSQTLVRTLLSPERESLDSVSRLLYPKNPVMHKIRGTLENFAGKRLEHIDATSMETMKRYALRDSRISMALFRDLIKEQGNTKTVRDHLDLQNWSFQRGLHPVFELDRNLLNEYTQNIAGEAQRACASADVIPEDLQSTARFAKMLADRYGVRVPKKPSPTTDKKMIPALSKGDVQYKRLQIEHPDLRPVWHARNIVKQSRQETARARRLLIHATPEGLISLPLKVSAAITHRLGGMNRVNTQNFKRNGVIRRAVRAREGWVVVWADASQIECRFSSGFCGAEVLASQFNAGLDTYSLFASEIYGVPVDRKRKETRDDGTVFCPDEAKGFVGKVCILSLQYRVGGKKLVKRLYLDEDNPVAITEEEGHRIVRVYRQKNIQIPAMWKKLEHMIYFMAVAPEGESRDIGPFTFIRNAVVLPNGLHIRYRKLRNVSNDPDMPSWVYKGRGGFEHSLHGAHVLENLMQALAGVHVNNVLLEAERSGAVIGIQVHDEIVGLAPESEAEQAAQYLGELMATPQDWMQKMAIPMQLKADYGFDHTYS